MKQRRGAPRWPGQPCHSQAAAESRRHGSPHHEVQRQSLQIQPQVLHRGRPGAAGGRAGHRRTKTAKEDRQRGRDAECPTQEAPEQLQGAQRPAPGEQRARAPPNAQTQQRVPGAAGGDPARQDGQEALENRDPHLSQELHQVPNRHHPGDVQRRPARSGGRRQRRRLPTHAVPPARVGRVRRRALGSVPDTDHRLSGGQLTSAAKAWASRRTDDATDCWT